MAIIIKTDQELELMRDAGKATASVLKLLALSIRPGMKTSELDTIASSEALKLGGKPSFKGFRGFPANLCVSINNEVVHGIPGDRIISEGDVVSLDFGLKLRGFQGDTALTIGVGKINPKTSKLIKVTKEALEAGIQAARNGNRVGDISTAIQKHVESHGFAVVREYTGHGIGRQMHEDPHVPNFGQPGTGPLLKRGMTIALEPMVTAGDWRTRLGNDGWVVYTADDSLAAHFEHTIAITEGDAEILTVN